MDTGAIMLKVQKYIPKDILSQNVLRDKLDKLDDAKRKELDKKIDELADMNTGGLYNPTFIFFIDLFFGWIGATQLNVLKEKTFLSFARPLLFALCFIFGMLANLGSKEPLQFNVASLLLVEQIGGLLVLIVLILWIIGLFFVGKATRRYNLKKILSALD